MLNMPGTTSGLSILPWASFGCPRMTIGAAVWIPPSGDGAVDMVRRAGVALAAAVALGVGAMEIDAGFGGFKDEIEV